jgi:hypothetical protein
MALDRIFISWSSRIGLYEDRGEQKIKLGTRRRIEHYAILSILGTIFKQSDLEATIENAPGTLEPEAEFAATSRISSFEAL